MSSPLEPLVEGLIRAFQLIASFDPEVYGIMFLSLRVSGTATILAALVAIPFGAFVGLHEFVGRRLLINVVNTLMGLPPVVVGLVVYLILSSRGWLGPLNLLYTPTAMIIAQLIMCVPIVAGITISSVRSVEKKVVDSAKSLGATDWQVSWTILSEARTGLMTAIITAFGAAISEVGAIMIVGGNIQYYTRALTTAIVLETRMGEFDLALALGIILLALSFAVNLLLTHLQMREAR